MDFSVISLVTYTIQDPTSKPQVKTIRNKPTYEGRNVCLIVFLSLL